MTVVEDHRMDDPRDQFPIGMRVLAVDDDPTCLMLLENLLRRCQYHDMDGFKLLELVGLEMDLPVIMLSVNDDPKMVMKGITHGACDYLLKPVRIEELQIIWQHVIRRRKTDDSKDHNKTSNQNKPNADNCNGRVSEATGNSDKNEKPSKKRKDQDEDDDEDHEDDHYNEDPSSQKKPRVVWSMELHSKFVCAVNQLGIDKAVPKKILDLMNVEKLTRENKYRLYLKRISRVENQQANMVAALGTADLSYLRMGSLSRVTPLQTLTGPQQFHNNAFRSFQPGGMIGRFNTSVGLNVHGLPSSENRQLGHAQNLNSSINDPLKFQSSIACGNHNGIQRMPISAGLDQLQHDKGASVGPIQNLPPPEATFPMPNNALTEDTQGRGVYENLTQVTSQNSQISFPWLDHGRFNDIWPSPVQSSGTNSYPPSDVNLSGASAVTSLCNQSHDSQTDRQCQGVFFTNNSGQMSNKVPFQEWDDHIHDSSYHSNVLLNSTDCLIPVNPADTEGHNSNKSTFNRDFHFNLCDQFQMKRDGIMGLSEDNSLKTHQGYIMNQQRSQNSRVGSLEDLVNSLMTPVMKFTQFD
ncbi:hypothetical protein Fmac_031908 [Flemingia macrophylla]|uniref:Two-component response regulator n=1 Tax=Flemingia macrophylla TaxID=520843 RepID=A0ABD1L3E2_9FABA